MRHALRAVDSGQEEAAELAADEFEVVVVNTYYKDDKEQQKNKKVQYTVAFLTCVCDFRHGIGHLLMGAKLAKKSITANNPERKNCGSGVGKINLHRGGGQSACAFPPAGGWTRAGEGIYP
jgi:hypothetical protein